MLQNAYLLAKIGADTAENEQHFAEILPKICPEAVAQAAEARRPEGHVPDRPRGARGQGGPLAAQARGFSKKEEEPPTSRLPLATNRAIFCAVFQRYTAGRGPFV